MTDILVRAYEIYLSGPAPHLFFSATVYQDLVPSLVRLLLGYGLAVAVAVALGVGVGLVRLFADVFDPLLHFLRSVPPPALIPLFLVLLGIGDQMKIGLIAFAVMWPVLLNTIDGIRTVPAIQIDTGRVYGIGTVSRVLQIILPSAAPKIFAGLRVGLSIAVIVMVLSEMLAATNGIGFVILDAQRSFHVEDMWAGIVVLGVIGYCLNAALLAAEGRILAWHRASKGATSN